DALENVIGLDYSGYLIHDGFASYDRFLDAIHQLCVGHPMRRAHDMELNLSGRDKLFPRQVIDLMQEALATRDAFLLEPPSEDDRGAAYEAFSERMRDLAVRPRTHQLNETFAAHLEKYSHPWFPFLLNPD